MTFDDILDQAIALLQRRGRVTYRTLKRQFGLGDDVLEDLKEELIYGQRLAMDEDGRVLVWTGGAIPPESSASPPPPQEGPHTAPPVAPHPADAERRQLTVLFCDLVDSTVLASQLDPEEWREVVRAYQDTCAKVIARFEGHIAQYLGDGLLVYFSYPRAHEDDAQRAVRAGLGMVEAMGQLNTRLELERGVELAVRLGCHTGLVAHNKALPTEVIEQVVAKTDGVPLFVEELTKMVLESGLLQEREERYELTGPLPPLAIPTTLHDSLMARLDRLAAVKAMAQLGATLGREFSYALLQAVSPWDEGTLQRGLHQLVAAEFLYQRGLPPQATYHFKHALIQDAAYQSLLRSTRQQSHQRIGQVLEARFPEVSETQPELLAHHYTEAGLNAQSIPYWQRAGQRAVERSANLEAVAHLTKGLEGLATLPDTPERAQPELLVQTTLGPALMATKGYGSPEVLRTYARARELCQHVGETPQLFQVLRGLWYFYLIRLELRTARELGEQLHTLAQHVGDSALLLESHYALGNTLNYLGEFVAARSYLEQGIAIYDPQRHRAHAFRYGQDPGVACRSYAAVTLWWLGYPDQALQRSHEALRLAREVAHPFSRAYVLFFAALLHHFRREGQLTQERAEEQVALSGEHGFPQLLAGGRFLQCWALVEQGRGAEGMAQMHQGMAAWRATGAEVVWPYYLALLAEADAKGGQVEESLTLVAEALAAANDREERRWDAELYRLKGELLLQDSAAHQVGAEESLEQALDVARRQEAKSLELRAAMSLSRLWQQQGKRDEARELLAPVYAWFTEGFDTVDLQEAKALLEELGG